MLRVSTVPENPDPNIVDLRFPSYAKPTCSHPSPTRDMLVTATLPVRELPVCVKSSVACPVNLQFRSCPLMSAKTVVPCAVPAHLPLREDDFIGVGVIGVGLTLVGVTGVGKTGVGLIGVGCTGVGLIFVGVTGVCLMGVGLTGKDLEISGLVVVEFTIFGLIVVCFVMFGVIGVCFTIFGVTGVIDVTFTLDFSGIGFSAFLFVSAKANVTVDKTLHSKNEMSTNPLILNCYTSRFMNIRFLWSDSVYDKNQFLIISQ